MLRDFLSYAADGGSQPAPAGATRAVAPVDPLVDELASRLRGAGLVVHSGYGTSAQRLDLAVEDPHRRGRVLVAVETDGPRYAAMSSTRDRDRLRIEQLRRLGWEHLRIWTTDLFRDPARDAARVVAAVRRASDEHRHNDETAVPAIGEQTQEEEAQDEQSSAPSTKVQAAEVRSKPEQTRDDTDAGWGERSSEGSHDQWLQEQRPPHWG